MGAAGSTDSAAPSSSPANDYERSVAWLDENHKGGSGFDYIMDCVKGSRALAALLADVRRETIEACAKACDVEADAHNDSPRGTSSSDELLAAGDRARSARGCARRIRALHTKRPAVCAHGVTFASACMTCIRGDDPREREPGYNPKTRSVR